MEKERKVRPDCANASNPFHVCAEYCSSRTSSSAGRGSKPPARIESSLRLVVNRVKEKGDGVRVSEGRGVDPRCVNASNPFHKCADYCSQNTPGSTKPSPSPSPTTQPGGAIKKSKEGVVKTGESRKVDPRCPNASNPFHQCGEHCAHKFQSKERAAVSKKSDK